MGLKVVPNVHGDIEPDCMNQRLVLEVIHIYGCCKLPWAPYPVPCSPGSHSFDSLVAPITPSRREKQSPSLLETPSVEEKHFANVN